MKPFFLVLTLLITCNLLSGQLKAQPSIEKYPSGFYKVSKTENSKKGFYLAKNKTYYQLHEAGYLSLNTVDSVYDQMDQFQLAIIIKFKEKEKNALLKFTSLYKAQEIGLFVNGELLLAATIMEPIRDGTINYSSNSDKAEIRHIMAALNYALKKESDLPQKK